MAFFYKNVSKIGEITKKLAPKVPKFFDVRKVEGKLLRGVGGGGTGGLQHIYGSHCHQISRSKCLYH